MLKDLAVYCEEIRGVQIRRKNIWREEERSFSTFIVLLLRIYTELPQTNKTKGKQQRTFPNSMTSLFK
jgi:hypothetical protein